MATEAMAGASTLIGAESRSGVGEEAGVRSGALKLQQQPLRTIGASPRSPGSRGEQQPQPLDAQVSGP
jgi:hypothetical protein